MKVFQKLFTALKNVDSEESSWEIRNKRSSRDTRRFFLGRYSYQESVSQLNSIRRMKSSS